MTLLRVRLQQAFDLLRLQHTAEARDVLQSLVDDELADAVVWETLGDVRDKLGDSEGAVEAWKQAIDLYLARQMIKRAEGVLELLLILRPDDVDALATLAGLKASAVDS